MADAHSVMEQGKEENLRTRTDPLTSVQESRDTSFTVGPVTAFSLPTNSLRGSLVRRRHRNTL